MLRIFCAYRPDTHPLGLREKTLPAFFFAVIRLPKNNPQANAVSAVKGNIGDNDAMKGTAGTFNPQQAEKPKPANPRKHRSFFIR